MLADDLSIYGLPRVVRFFMAQANNGLRSKFPVKERRQALGLNSSLKGSTLLSLKPLVCRRRSEQNWNIW